MKHIALFAPLAAVAIALPARAADTPPAPPPRGEMKGPPAFDPALCQAKPPGATVETKTPDGRVIRGKCQLVFLPDPPARPNDPPRPGKAP